MKVTIAVKAKEILSKIIPHSSKIRFLSYLPKLNVWIRTHKENCRIFQDRYKLYDYLNNDILKNEKINYLEFGVFKGESIKYWSNINSDKESVFFGFDTFTGLPDEWQRFADKLGKNHFDAKGEIPEIEDHRVNFVKGLFQKTLPDFLKSHSMQSQLIIHCDADLYSAALYILTKCNDIIVPGTIIIFDEFSTILDEFRALEDYCSSYIRDYIVLGATKSSNNYYSQVAIQMK
jgi:hypothetical protein